ncbi:MAG: DUF2730 family protein [Desulfovibrionaceae bacterium]
MPFENLFAEGATLLVLVVQGLFAWALWSLRRVFVRSDEFALHVSRESRAQQALDNRLTALESRVAQLPDGEALSGLAAAVESLRGDIKVVDARISGVDRLMVRLERALDRQDNYLRHQA